MNPYLEVRFYCENQLTEILIQELALSGFDSFLENEDGFCAYIQVNELDQKKLDSILDFYGRNKIPYSVKEIKNENWNQKWEEDYEPVLMLGKYLFRAPFHTPGPHIEKDFIVYPGMAFGTGHHETTTLMIEALDTLPLKGKDILDFGCGTCILSLFAEYKGAASVLAIDNDEWAVESARKNIELNHSEIIELKTAEIDAVNHAGFDFILANINRNVILESIDELDSLLKPQGSVITSGFLQEDVKLLEKGFGALGFRLVKSESINNWCLCIFAK